MLTLTFMHYDFCHLVSTIRILSQCSQDGVTVDDRSDQQTYQLKYCVRNGRRNVLSQEGKINFTKNKLIAAQGVSVIRASRPFA